MFGLFKNRSQAKALDAELRAQMESATNNLGQKWLQFHEELKFKDDVPLSEIIEIFLSPAREFVLKKYPGFSNAPNSVIWMMVFSAVMKSETHSKDEVNEAVSILESKYAK